MTPAGLIFPEPGGTVVLSKRATLDTGHSLGYDRQVMLEIVSKTMDENLQVNPLPTGQAPPDEAMCWYVLKVQSNREKSIRDSLLRSIKRDGLEVYFGEVIIPTEKVVETKGGKKKITERKLYPGYLMIQMILNDETFYLVRNTSGVGDFTGAAGKPIAMQDHEIKRMLGQEEVKLNEPTKVKIGYARGDVVKIKEGPFESFEGSIDSIDEANGKVTVLVEIFGRSTPTELEYWQVEGV